MSKSGLSSTSNNDCAAPSAPPVGLVHEALNNYENSSVFHRRRETRGEQFSNDYESSSEPRISRRDSPTTRENFSALNCLNEIRSEHSSSHNYESDFRQTNGKLSALYRQGETETEIHVSDSKNSVNRKRVENNSINVGYRRNNPNARNTENNSTSQEYRRNNPNSRNSENHSTWRRGRIGRGNQFRNYDLEQTCPRQYSENDCSDTDSISSVQSASNYLSYETPYNRERSERWPFSLQEKKSGSARIYSIRDRNKEGKFKATGSIEGDKKNYKRHNGKHGGRSKHGFLIAEKGKGKNKEQGVSYVGYKYIEELSHKEPHEIIIDILKENSAFNAFLVADKLEPDWLFLIMKIISKVCVSDFAVSKNEVLQHICRSKLLDRISVYLGDIVVEKNERTKQNLKSFIEDLATFYAAIVDSLPSVAVEKEFDKLAEKTRIAILILTQMMKIEVDESTIKNLNIVIEKLKEEIEMIARKKNSVKKIGLSYLDVVEGLDPPDDFRKLSLYPTYGDLRNEDFGFVRPNKLKGAYLSVEHYLDVQFRLIREDFIDPFRQGLKKYIEAMDQYKAGKLPRIKFKYESLRFYPKIKFQEMEITEKNQVGYLVNFDSQKTMRNTKWEYSKRFMFGSLLLFTNDQFNTFFYGTVLKRDLQKLKEGQILVAFTEDVQVDPIFFTHDFLMAESEVLFYPYFLVMKSLKTFKEKNFPMKKYIVDGEYITTFPKYILNGIQMDIFKFPSVNPFFFESWPTASQLGFDDYQYEAFRNALISDFCVIHGAPGTGKTYIGLKIVEVLLQNIKTNLGMIRAPILIVCYTNHALDQFLEDILLRGLTQKLVRVGGQSKSELLTHFNLRGRNQTVRREDASSRQLGSAMFTIRREVKNCLNEITELTGEKKKLDTPTGILKYGILQRVMSAHERDYFKNEKNLLNWLLESNELDESEFPVIREVELPTVQSPIDEDAGELLADQDDIEDGGENDALVDEDDLFIAQIDISQFVSGMEYCLEVKNEMELYTAELEEYSQLQSLRDKATTDYAFYHNSLKEIERSLKIRYNTIRVLEIQLADCSFSLEKYKALMMKDPFVLPLPSRWMIYKNWISILRSELIKKLQKAEEKYRNKLAQYEEFKQIEDLTIFQQSEIVGMTTTCAARLQDLLRSLKPAIVIVEEAAEVLEAHIVTSLTHKCEQVILIGDHKQLRPSSAAYKLSKDYNINVSLFERMINNGMKCPRLKVQHRMRPQISKLITPLIYKNLEDHPDVHKYKAVKGVTTSLYFFEHNKFEQEEGDSTSRKNIFEADFALDLCRYLVLQGYSEDEITILTTYTGQMFLLREKKRNVPLIKNVKCIVVDKYQGEENKIIILSLVRSNKKKKIGFLKTENRVCVALSRAREGMFIIGNMDNLASNGSLWTSIKETLKEQNSIGNELKLYCDRHLITTTITNINDFDKVREGGCSYNCGEILECGHTCKRMCHQLDREHTNINCREPCGKTCPRLHPCKLFCYQDCEKCFVPMNIMPACGKHDTVLPCHTNEKTYKCQVIVPDVSPLCNHQVQRKCHENVEDVQCPSLCEDRLDCGHCCDLLCHKNNDPYHIEYKCKHPCEKDNKYCKQNHKCKKLCFEECGMCSIMVTHKLPCGHEENMRCSVDIEKIKCHQKCRKICKACNKRCSKLCHEDCAPCLNKIDKVIPDCGHTKKVQCHERATRAFCDQKCELNAPCGHKCKLACKVACDSEACHELVRVSNVRSLCGHNFVRVRCYEKCTPLIWKLEDLVKNCDEPCHQILKCEDICAGTCGECWQGRLHKICNKICGSIMICGHSCKFPCKQLCPPCGEECTFQCRHSKCPHKCGVPCVPCKEQCGWGCIHSQCTKKCGETCDREACTEECSKILNCGHPCIGFCGEPCPPICRQCNPEITEIVFGYEDEPNARFVYMEDCQHTIESQALDMHLQMSPEGGEIVMKTCPLCKTLITRTLRYKNEVKKTYTQVIEVKTKIFGNTESARVLQKEFQQKVTSLRENSRANLVATGLTQIGNILDNYTFKCYNAIQKKRIMFLIPIVELKAMLFYYGIFVEITSRLGALFEVPQNQNDIGASEIVVKKTSNVNKLHDHELVIKILKIVKSLMNRIEPLKYYVNSQLSEDIELELRKYFKMTDLLTVVKSPLYKMNQSGRSVCAVYRQLKELLFGLAKFTARNEEQVNGLFNELRRELESKESLTNEEKYEIKLAMNYSGSSGHWYQCSKGHFYCITECGLPMQEYKCPECGVRIGGTNHMLVSTTRLSNF